MMITNSIGNRSGLDEFLTVHECFWLVRPQNFQIAASEVAF